MNQEPASAPVLEKRHEAFLSTLRGIVGADFVASDPSMRYIYSRDLTENEAHWPLGVVMPAGVEAVCEIVRAAGREGVPLVPFTYGLNMGGLTIPGQDAVIVDLKRMRKIVEVREEDLYMIV